MVDSAVPGFQGLQAEISPWCVGRAVVGFEPAAYDGGSYRSVLHYFPLQHRKLSAAFDFGQTLFAFMTEATSSAMDSIIESAPLIKKIRINKMIFPVEKKLCLRW